ncbi:MAG: hypothetical protein ABI442_00165 [Gemmatimonadaceae bacterium]
MIYEIVNFGNEAAGIEANFFGLFQPNVARNVAEVSTSGNAHRERQIRNGNAGPQ